MGLARIPISPTRHRLQDGYKTALLFAVALAGCFINAGAQVDSSLQKLQNAPAALDARVVNKLTSKYSDLQKDITAQTQRVLNNLQKKEARLKKKLQGGVDSTGATQLLAGSKQFYQSLQNKLNTASSKLTKLSHYIPGLDSLQSAARFLQNAGKTLVNFSPDRLNPSDPLNQLSSSVNGVQGQMQAGSEINQLLGARQQQLQAALQPLGLSSNLTSMNKQVYYYQQQLNEYKSLLQDQQKLEQKLLATVRQLPAFQHFMSKYSLLAQLFPQPATTGTSQALAGLQTQSAVQQQLQQQLGSANGAGGGPNAQAYLQQQVQAAQAQLNQLKDKLNSLIAGGGAGGTTSATGSIIMPTGFTPNPQKTKSFFQRLEFGFNIQSQRTNTLLPATSDLALTMGYKLSSKATIGIGASYKLGWGYSLSHISMSNQGIGLRSFIDIKLKGSIWIMGGYEQNWLPQLATILDSVAVATTHPSGWGAGWQQSGLVGLEKKYKIGKKAGNFQLLWDFLSYSQIPATPAFKFRIGYSL